MLGESHTIKINLQWEQTRYLSAMIYNVNCTKKSQMIKPMSLFPLPQDKLIKTGLPKSTRKQYDIFKELAENAGVKF